MILHGNQRAGAVNLTNHLMNDQDNDHVEVHEIRGCVSDTLPGALQEMYAISRATRCKQFMFSVSLNPPKGERVAPGAFEDAANRIEKDVGLEGQPRVLVFHEKCGRRHAHCVWSRINTDEMKAVNLPFYKMRLKEVSIELFLDHGWKMPPGLANRQNRNPLNCTLEEWQQAKRFDADPRCIKTTLRTCWAQSDSKRAFEQALKQQGYYLARGDRRGFVAVDWRGEVYSLSRWLDQKAKALRSRLGEAKELPSVDDTKNRIDEALIERFRQHEAKLKEQHAKARQALNELKRKLVQKQRGEREALRIRHEKRWNQEAHQRSARLRTGWRGMWDKVTGHAKQVQEKNGRDAYDALKRDQADREQLIWSHITARAVLEQRTKEQRSLEAVQTKSLDQRFSEHARSLSLKL